MSAVRRILATALVAVLLLEVVTGWALATVYTPSTHAAWPSVVYIERQMPAGTLVRGLHQAGAHVAIALVLALLASWIWGATYRAHRRAWLALLGGGALVLLFAITGNVLPWDEGGYWGAKTEMGIVTAVPLIGPFVARTAQGGPELGQLSLTRMYALHASILPAILAGVAAFLLAPLRKRPWSPADRAVLIGSAGGALITAYALVWISGGATLDAPATAGEEFAARPEWYFRPLNQLLSMAGPAGQGALAALVPLLVAGFMGALPWIDPSGGGPRRLLRLAPLGMFGAGCTALLVISLARDASDPDFQAALERASAQRDRAIRLAAEGVPPEGPLAMLRSDPAFRAGWLFDQHCAKCHRFHERGPGLDEQTAPDLTGFGTAAWAEGVLRDPDAATRFGKTPFAGMMPSMVTPPTDPEEAKYFTAMKPEEIGEVTAFLAAQATGDRAEGSPGEKLVRERCTSCHRLDGATEDEDSLAPELRGWASAAWIEAQIADPASGAAYPAGSRDPALEGHMPAFDGELDPADRRLLADWIANAGHPPP
jgi:ubiquinol-cytochrome c reductase cytochrome b subunit